MDLPIDPLDEYLERVEQAAWSKDYSTLVPMTVKYLETMQAEIKGMEYQLEILAYLEFSEIPKSDGLEEEYYWLEYCIIRDGNDNIFQTKR